MIKVLLLTVALMAMGYALVKSSMGSFIHPHYLFIIGIQGALALIAHTVGKQGLANKQSAYSYFMGGSMFRLLFSLGLLTAYLFMYKQSREGIIWATVNFLIIYILYAVMEIASFLSNLRRVSAHQTII